MKHSLQSRPLPRDIHSSWRIGIVHALYYKEHVQVMVEGAGAVLRQAGIAEENIMLHPVPGSFEIPLVGSALAKEQSVDALIGLGIIIEGETEHAALVADHAARGMMDVQTHYGIPFSFEVIYADSLETAIERTVGDVNKGKEAAYTVLESLAKLATIQS